jgi:hypothetical protein
MSEFIETDNPSPSPAAVEAFAPTAEDERWMVATFNAADPAPTTLLGAVEVEVHRLRRCGGPFAGFIAGHLERLAQMVAWTSATTPQEHEERIEIADDESRARWFDRGYTEGIEAARRELAPYRPE